jgi:hypothetical protein
MLFRLFPSFLKADHERAARALSRSTLPIALFSGQIDSPHVIPVD